MKAARDGEPISLATNSFWMLIDFAAGLYAQTFLFAAYVVLAVWGLVE